MKRRTDPRHLRRKKAVKALFSFSFQKKKMKKSLVKSVVENLDTIDKAICQHAPEWPIEKIGKVDLAILRLALYELEIDKTQPPKVIIDEAVELAKEFGGQSSPGFVNGVLGAVLLERGKV